MFRNKCKNPYNIKNIFYSYFSLKIASYFGIFGAYYIFAAISNILSPKGINLQPQSEK